MDQKQQIENVTKLFGGYEPLLSVLVHLISQGITGTFADYAAFKASILANRAAGKDWYMRARMEDTSHIYEYFPDTKTINWTASQKKEVI